MVRSASNLATTLDFKLQQERKSVAHTIFGKAFGANGNRRCGTRSELLNASRKPQTGYVLQYVRLFSGRLKYEQDTQICVRIKNRPNNVEAP